MVFFVICGNQVDEMPRVFRCDLHIHTCLSPCAELDMYPTAIVKRAEAEGLDMIAICDHNASENVHYVRKAARGTGLIVLPGMEVTSREEVHVIALFDDPSVLECLQEMVYNHLPGKNNEDAFGMQVIVNDEDEVEGFNERLLIGATELALSDVTDTIHRLGGLAIASHIDRESFSVLSQLGFIDEDASFDALEVTRSLGVREGRRRYPELASFPFVTASDAHIIDDIGTGRMLMKLVEGTTGELLLAFAGRDGRCILD